MDDGDFDGLLLGAVIDGLLLGAVVDGLVVGPLVGTDDMEGEYDGIKLMDGAEEG